MYIFQHKQMRGRFTIITWILQGACFAAGLRGHSESMT
jgi:hypothetical protein